ncbi:MULTISPECIES: GNAT family N-acetyltransferase [unclassified Sphingomonas]|uniref:GNAT family N-acetyltransferase n=1 Tax=unclassified Sphingomonas TaxID=196159 RepID=UPI002150D2CC|nr:MULTISPECIES: GNAT family N-acetyltransferase [unclassified Sphingomonas]MCR5872411.1 GNAT family N-acetyltransferase [Sphingomonas sp. J344]UUX99303.1 GNAT family N-acetyltransferase [Sphingomonas sp. J315]
MSHPLDRPIWSSLATGWAAIAEGTPAALRVDRNIGLFGATADESPESLAALDALVPEDGELWLVERQPWKVPDGIRLAKEGLAVQMVLDALVPDDRAVPDIVPLDDADGAEMFALATLTEPGPYVRHSNRLGGFVGVKVDGQLIAMAGERMRLPGYAEISAVCTHPDWRGRGLAGHLTRHVANVILARGETPFLHCYASNRATIALYERMGFRIRTDIRALILARMPTV